MTPFRFALLSLQSVVCVAAAAGLTAGCGGSVSPAAWDTMPRGLEPPAPVRGGDEASRSARAESDDAVEIETTVSLVDNTGRTGRSSDDRGFVHESATQSAGPTTLNSPVVLVGPDVQSTWLGGAWDGAPARLAANPQALNGACTGVSERPEVGHFAMPAYAALGAGLAVPDDAWIVVTLAAIERADDRCAAAAGARHVVEIGRGGLLVVSGPVDSGVRTPGDALARPDLVVHAFTGWSMQDGAWQHGTEPVWARLDVPSTARPDVCAARIDEHIDQLVDAAWARRLGSPRARQTADDTLRDLVRGSTDVEHLAAAWLDDVDDNAATRHLAESDAVLDVCSSSLGARVVVALVQDAAGLPDAALATLDVSGTALRMPPIRSLEALLRWRSGDDAGALDAIDATLELDVDRFDVRLLRARIVRDAIGDAERARTALASLDAPVSWSATRDHELATALHDLGAFDEAEVAWTRALIDDPTWAEPANALGCMHFAADAIDLARSWFTTAIERDPLHAPAHNNLGFLAASSDGDIDAAEASYERATALDPGLASAWFNLGSLRERHRADLDGAAVAYRAAIEAAPTHRDAAEALARIESRPDASYDALVGSWSSTNVINDAVVVSLVTFFGDGRVTFVERRNGGLPAARSGHLSIEQVDGARLTGLLDDGSDARCVIEFISADRIVVTVPDAAVQRVIYDRRVGDDVAGASPTSA